MCGICGYVGPAYTEADPDAIVRMRDVLTHRGPDGGADLAIKSLDGSLSGAFGHRRLKIIDLTEAADQPMCSDDGALMLTYNGEIYNFRSLRGDLEARGHTFRSTGDTEVVLRAYEEWGDRFVERLDGMFALALWNARAGTLLLARDRTGKKPLYYTEAGGRFTFGSEPKALFAAPWVDPAPDFRRLPEFLTFGYVPYPNTLYDGVHQVPPGATVQYGRGGISTSVYWDAPPRVDGAPADVASEVASLVDAAVRRRMISDVPLGALLSGGIDSSIVVGLMARATAEPVRTFSIGFPEDESFDERPFALRVAEHFSTSHTEFAVRADAVALMDTLLWHHDQPYADSSAIPTYLVCQLAREHVTVALNGDGGDEVFGGYDRFTAAAIAARLPRFAARVGRRAARLLPRTHGYYSARRRAERFFELAESHPKQQYQSWISVINEDLLDELLSPRLRALAEAPPTASMDECYARVADAPLLDQILYANFKTYLPDDLAPKMDRMSMANSLETRSPFLDTALIEFMAHVPAKRKVGLRTLKPILRDAFGPLLPAEIWERRKHGFGVPMDRWFRTDLRQMFEDEVLAADARVGQVLEQSVVERLWREHQASERNHGFRFWTVLTLERWMRSLEAPALPAPPRVDVVSA